MIGSFRNFAKTKFAGLLVFIMIIPFVFWGMGSMFSSGNTNNIAKINKTNISTQDFIDHINNSNIPDRTIRENLQNNIIEELLSTLVSTKLLNLEIEDFNIHVSEKTLLKKIKKNKNFLNENGSFERIKYEKFLLENNQSAPGFELRLKNRELQKNLFDYIGAGTTTPKFLVKKLFIQENRKLLIDFFNLKEFYKKKADFNDKDLQDFLDQNNEQLKINYLDFEYAILNPKNLIGSDEFNQAFFDKIDEIEIEISNNTDLKTILEPLDIEVKNVLNFKYSQDKNKIEKKIFEARNIEFDILEDNNNYIIYKINKSEERAPDLKDKQLKEEIYNLVIQKNKFDYNQDLLKKINDKKFTEKEFKQMGKDQISSLTINSIKDNKKFNINAIELLYALPIKSITLINDENGNIYLAQIKSKKDKKFQDEIDNLKEYENKQDTKNKNSILKSYDLLLNKKYNVVLNQKTIERVKNFFQ